MPACQGSLLQHCFTHAEARAHAPAQYKFVVDGEWRYAPDQAAMYDEGNNVNNVLEVQEYVPENLDSLSGFDPPPSPPSRCRFRPNPRNDLGRAVASCRPFRYNPHGFSVDQARV